MHRLNSLGSSDFNGASKGCEVRPTGNRSWVAQDNVVGALPQQVEIDIKAHAIGADIIQSGINHTGSERIDLNFPRTEMGAPCAGERHMERTLQAQIVAQGRLVMISDGYSSHPGEDGSSVDFGNTL